MTLASPTAFKYEAEFRPGQGSALGEGTSLADQMALRLAKNVSPARPNRCISAAAVWPQPLLRQDPTLGPGRRERVGGRGRGPAREVSWGSARPVFLPRGWTAQLWSLRLRQGISAPCDSQLSWPMSSWSWGRRDIPFSSKSPSSRWQDVRPAALRASRGLSRLFKNFNQQLPARRTARLGPAGWKPTRVHPQKV